MKKTKMKVDFLGDESICLGKSDNNIGERINNCNQLFELYANNDRRFFCNTRTGNIAKFDMQGKYLVFYDRYTGHPIYNTHKTDKHKWKGNFNDGGSNQDIVMCLANYIKTGIPFFYWWLRANDSGYSEEALNKIRKFGVEKNIFTIEKRYRFWVHSEKNIHIIDEYIKENDIDIDKCVKVYVNSGDVEPAWVKEFNFLHAKSIT